MSKISNDLEALISFRAHLAKFNRELAESFSSIRGHWRGLGEVWTDPMYQKFGDALNEVNAGIDRYLAATDGHEAHLTGLIRVLEEYLARGRM